MENPVLIQHTDELMNRGREAKDRDLIMDHEPPEPNDLINYEFMNLPSSELSLLSQTY